MPTPLRNSISNKLISFARDLSPASWVIHRRVNAAVQESILSQSQMWSLQGWYAELCAKPSCQIELSTSDVLWLYDIWEFWYHHTGDDGAYSFNPSHTCMPGFRWKPAVITEFKRVHQNPIELLNRVNRVSGLFGAFPQLAKLAERNKLPKTVIEPQHLAQPYQAVCQVMTFILSNDRELFGISKATTKITLERKLRAFVTLLLFASDWNASSAIDKYISLVNVTDIGDVLEDDIIGFDMFRDHQVSNALAHLQQMDIPYIKKTVSDVEADMRESCIQYAITNDIPALPAPHYPGNLKRQTE